MDAENVDMDSRQGPFPISKEEFLDRILQNKTDNLDDLNNGELLHEVFDDGKTILLKACMETKVKSDTVKFLLEKGANIRYKDKNQWEPLHYAAQRADISVLKVIIDKLKSEQNDLNKVLVDQYNAIHILILYGNHNSPEFVKCAELLIDEGVHVNSKNEKEEITLLQCASKIGNKKLVELLIAKGADVKKTTDNYKRTPLEYATMFGYHEVFEILIEKHEDTEINEKNILSLLLQNYDNPPMPFSNYNLCCKHLFTKVRTIDVNKRDKNNKNTLLHYATRYSDTEVIVQLLNHGADLFSKNKYGFMPIDYLDPEKLEELLDYYIQGAQGGTNPHFNDEEFRVSLNFSMLACREKVLAKENTTSSEQNNADSTQTTKEACENTYCVESETTKKKQPITVSLGTNTSKEPLLPQKQPSRDSTQDTKEPPDSEPSKEKPPDTDNTGTNTSAKQTTGKPERNTSENFKTINETHIIDFMQRNPELRHLLKHPLIHIFLLIKWRQTKYWFFTNIVFYLIFCISLVTYILFFHEDLELSACKTFLWYVSLIILLVTFLILICREVLQVLTLKWKYFFHFENWVEIMLIFLVGLIFFTGSSSISTRKQLSSVSILLAVFELIFMASQHPILSTNLVMLRTVSYNYFKFLLWYSFLIIGFWLSFYILFARVPKESSTNSTMEDNDPFGDLAKSFIKAILMITGDFDDIKFETWASGFIIIIFVFLIFITLNNLLNALAISDIQSIKNDAELVSNIDRAQYINRQEIICLEINKFIPLSLTRKINLQPKFLDTYEFTLNPNEKRLESKKKPTKKNDKADKADKDDKAIKMPLDEKTIGYINKFFRKRYASRK